MAGVYRRRCWRDTVLRELLAHGPEDEAGDYLLCYFTGVPHWIGVLEVISEPFMDRTPISKNEVFSMQGQSEARGNVNLRHISSCS